MIANSVPTAPIAEPRSSFSDRPVIVQSTPDFQFLSATGEVTLVELKSNTQATTPLRRKPLRVPRPLTFQEWTRLGFILLQKWDGVVLQVDDESFTAKLIDISVFGPGYGECVVLHLTNDQWVVIDSCVDAGSAEPTALKYLTSLGVDVATDVRVILATHYHDDHIAGIGELLEHCNVARFACSMALNSDDWTKLTEIYRGYLVTGGSGVDEIRRVMRELKRRAEKREIAAPIFCIAGRILRDLLNPPAVLACLSPSDAAVVAMHTRIREKLLPRARRRRLAVPSLQSNDGSVVLAVRVGYASALLGADLEERNRPGLGWQAVLDSHGASVAHYDGFKVPHHGSSTAYHPDVWNRLIVSNGWAVATPCNRQREPIPTKRDCERIRRMTKRSFITSPPGWSRFRHPNPTVHKTAEEATVKIGPEQPKHGHVRLRKLATTAGEWRIECFGHAVPLTRL